MIEIVPAEPYLIPSFYEALKSVASERIYLEMVEPPSLKKVTEFQLGLIEKKGPLFYALEKKENQESVIGWCDLFPDNNPRLKHRASLGMGIKKQFRGQGIGQRLIEASLAKAVIFGIEKVELSVYTSNTTAIRLYRRFGFEDEGVIRKYRKLDGIYYDCLMMGLFLEKF